MPKEKSVPSRKWDRQKFLMLGMSGVGKSEFWAQEEQALFLHLEPRLAHLSVYKVPQEACFSTFDEVKETLMALYAAAKDGKFPWTLKVVDTGDKLIELIQYDVVNWGKGFYKSRPINSIGDCPEGAGWHRATTNLSWFLHFMEMLPGATAILCHIKTEGDGKEKPYKDTISVGGQAGTKLLGWSDHTLHVRAKMVGERIDRNVRTIPHQEWEAKSSAGLIPDGMRWGRDVKENYQQFRGLFD